MAEGVCHGRGGMQRVSSIMEGGMQRVSVMEEKAWQRVSLRHGGRDMQRVSVPHGGGTCRGCPSWRERHAEGLSPSLEGEAYRGSLSWRGGMQRVSVCHGGEASRGSQLAAVGGGKVVRIVEAQEVKRGGSENRVRQDQRAQS